MQFIEDYLPLLVVIGPPNGYDPSIIERMNDAYERLWKQGKRYSLLSYTPRKAAQTGAHGRKLIAEWANRPRVRAMSKELCVGSATVVQSALERGAITALLWLWTPASPHHLAASAEDGLDYCIRQLEAAELPLGMPAAELRRTVLARIDE